MNVEASLVHPGLWQGSRPSGGYFVREDGFAILILCAEEYQPPAENFPGVRVIHAPNDDNPWVPPTRAQLNIALDAAKQAAGALRDGQKVLVTCWQGVNRSGLVTALTLHTLLGISGLEACAMIKQARSFALSNPQFVRCLTRIEATRPEADPKGI